MDDSFRVEMLDESIEEVRTSFKCDICQYETVYKQNLTRHISSVHKYETVPGPSSAQSPVPKKSLLMCQYCAKGFKSRSGLQVHIKDKHLEQFDYTCEVCGKGFNRLWNYRGHLSCHHKELREKCACGRQFQYKASLMQHKKQCTHEKPRELTNPKPFRCTVCGSTFTGNKTLKDHMRGSHGGKEYQCHVCGKLFRWRSSLSYHFRYFNHP